MQHSNGATMADPREDQFGGNCNEPNYESKKWKNACFVCVPLPQIDSYINCINQTLVITFFLYYTWKSIRDENATYSKKLLTISCNLTIGDAISKSSFQNYLIPLYVYQTNIEFGRISYFLTISYYTFEPNYFFKSFVKYKINIFSCVESCFLLMQWMNEK